MINVGLNAVGVEDLQEKVRQVEFSARTNKIVRRGISEAAQTLSKAIKQAAPVRRGRVLKRKYRRLLKRYAKKGYATQTQAAKARKRSTVVQKKFRSIKLVKGVRPQGPRELILPGQLKRSIHSRVKILRSGLVAKVGINVGLRRNDKRRAFHGHLVALGTKPRKTASGASRGVMPANAFARLAAATAAPAAMRLLNARIREDLDAAVAGLASAASRRAVP